MDSSVINIFFLLMFLACGGPPGGPLFHLGGPPGGSPPDDVYSMRITLLLGGPRLSSAAFFGNFLVDLLFKA